MLSAASDKINPGPLDFALAYLRAGLSVIPIWPGGKKNPCLSWKRYQSELPSEALARKWWKDGSKGIAIVCGAVSGNLELIDFDCGELFGPWCKRVDERAPGLAGKLSVVRTPRDPAGGYHVRYRCPEATIPGNTTLAKEPGTNPKTGEPDNRVLIQTRGEGGYGLAPGSPLACHETGRPYEHIAGPPLTALPVISASERDLLIAAARTFDLASKEGERSQRQEGRESDRKDSEPASADPRGRALVQSILAKLKGVTGGKRDQWSACCPAHDDRTPSLSITFDARGVGLKCHAGCHHESICKALGIPVSALFVNGRGFTQSGADIHSMEFSGDGVETRSAPLCVNPLVLTLVESCLPVYDGKQRVRQLGKLGRGLKALTETADLTFKELVPVVKWWHERYTARLQPLAKEGFTLADDLSAFRRFWEGNIKYPAGQGPFDRLWAESRPDMSLGLGEQLGHVADFCRRLQLKKGFGRPFPLPCRELGRVMRLSHMRAHDLLMTLESVGVLGRVETGAFGGGGEHLFLRRARAGAGRIGAKVKNLTYSAPEGPTVLVVALNPTTRPHPSCLPSLPRWEGRKIFCGSLGHGLGQSLAAFNSLRQSLGVVPLAQIQLAGLEHTGERACPPLRGSLAH
jgi:putative DNA primase/helicase